MQSSFHSQAITPAKLHIAIIMDGNGRWAERCGLPRTSGHVAGVAALEEVAEAAPEFGIATLSVFAFSADNWSRPPTEVDALMGLFRRFLRENTKRLLESSTRLSVIGRRDRLPHDLCTAIDRAEHETKSGEQLHLRIALDYSSRHSIMHAAARTDVPLARDSFSANLHPKQQYSDVDLLIRTSGEKRLSDFLLWESAYAELYFTDTLWPDFSKNDLAMAMQNFTQRDRRFGGINVNDRHSVHTSTAE